MGQYPWKTKGIVLTAPFQEDVDIVCEMIERKLAPAGVNLIVLQTRYRYEFKRHPECIGRYPLTEANVKTLLAACRKNGIRLIPKMNLFAHQSGRLNGPKDGILHGYKEGDFPNMMDGLLQAYPEFNETPEVTLPDYTYSICLSNKDAARIVCELMDELLEAFEADGMHIGCDEAFDLGVCPRCKGKASAKLFGDWITMLHDHLASRGAQTLVWGDRFLNIDEAGYRNGYESSGNGTEAAIGMVPKDIVMCDWHYGLHEAYKSVDIFADAGFQVLFSPWRIPENALAFYRYAKEHDRGHILGLLATTWCSSGELARALLKGEKPRWSLTPSLIDALDKIVFMDP